MMGINETIQTAQLISDGAKAMEAAVYSGVYRAERKIIVGLAVAVGAVIVLKAMSKSRKVDEETVTD